MTDDAIERGDLVLTTKPEADAIVVVVAGELDAHTAPSLNELGDRLQTEGHRRVVLDLAPTSFVDSSGLRSLIALHAGLAEAGGALALRAPSDPVVRLLEITSLRDHFTVVD